MRRAVSFFLCAAVAAFGQGVDRSKPPETPPLGAFKLPAMAETTLSNGLTVVTVRDERFPLVTARMAFGAGSRFDPQTQPGLAEAVAALLTEGTKSRKSRQIAEEAADIGGSLSGSATPDSLVIAGSALSEHAARLLDLMADVARHASFPADEVALYQQNRKQALLAQRSESSYLASEKTEEIVFGDHPYARQHPTPEAIDALRPETLAQFRDRLLTPNNAVLILIGKLPPQAVLMKALAERFGDWPKRDVPPPPSAPLPEPRRSLTLVDRPGSVQADVHVGRLGLTRRDPEFFPLLVGNTVLGGGASSRLFNHIREEKGYAYSVYSYNEAHRDAALFSAAMQVRNEVVEDAIRSLLAEMKRMAAEPVTPDELSAAKNYLSGNFVIRLQSQEALAAQIVNVKTMGLANDYLEMYTTRVRSAEPDQILKTAKKVIAPDHSAMVVVGDAAKIKPALEKFGAVRVVPAK
jgi:predicted Zn-dependent peptidase